MVDLHMHTTCSDGVYTPEQLTQMAVDAKLEVMAISDHDTVTAYTDGYKLNSNIRIIRAIEMSSEYDGEDVHILGYYLDVENEGLQTYCREFKESSINAFLLATTYRVMKWRRPWQKAALSAVLILHACSLPKAIFPT